MLCKFVSHWTLYVYLHTTICAYKKFYTPFIFKETGFKEDGHAYQ